MLRKPWRDAMEEEGQVAQIQVEAEKMGVMDRLTECVW